MGPLTIEAHSPREELGVNVGSDAVVGGDDVVGTFETSVAGGVVGMGVGVVLVSTGVEFGVSAIG